MSGDLQRLTALADVVKLAVDHTSTEADKFGSRFNDAQIRSAASDLNAAKISFVETLNQRANTVTEQTYFALTAIFDECMNEMKAIQASRALAVLQSVRGKLLQMEQVVRANAGAAPLNEKTLDETTIATAMANQQHLLNMQRWQMEDAARRSQEEFMRLERERLMRSR